MAKTYPSSGFNQRRATPDSSTYLRWVILAIALLASTAPKAALLSRLGGQAYYDDVLDVTWIANANLAATNSFGVSGIYGDGSMTLSVAGDWIAAMNASSYLGANDWRLPTLIDTNTAGCDWSYDGGTDCGYNVQTMSGGTVYSELAVLNYITLGNQAAYPPGGGFNFCPFYCPHSPTAGPFSNLVMGDGLYWIGTPYAPDPGSEAWVFRFTDGLQSNSYSLYFGNYAMVLRDGDIAAQAAVPIPAAAWLFGGALGALGMLGRRIRG